MAVAPPRHPGADREAESFSRWFAPFGSALQPPSRMVHTSPDVWAN